MKKRFLRTPKNYDGIASPTKNLSALLGDFLTDLRVEDNAQKEEVFKAWSAIIGENLAPLAIPVSWEQGTLIVKVKSSTLYSLLCTKEKPKLLQKLREHFPNANVKNISFRVG
jgi:hypothetical protein